MRKLLIGIAVLAAGMVPLGGQAAGSAPGTFVGEAGIEIPANSEFDLMCTSPAIESVLLATKVDFGSQGYFGFMASGGAGRGGTWVRAGETRVDVTPQTPVFSSGLTGIGVSFQGPAATLTLAAGIWGAPADCIFTLNGVETPIATQPADAGVHLSPAEMPAAVGAGSDGPNAMALSSYTRANAGTLFAFMTTDVGVTSVSGPGHVGGPSAGFLPWGTVFGETGAGDWTYEVIAGANPAFGGGNLWLLEIGDTPV